MLLADVYTRVGDVMNAHPQYLPTDATMRDAGTMIGEKRIVPIVDAECRLAGVVTLDDIAARYLQEHDLASGAQSRIAIQSMVRTLDGELLAGDLEGDWQGRVWVGAMRTESMVTLVQPGDMVVVGDRERPQNAAIELGVGCLVVVGGPRRRGGRGGRRLACVLVSRQCGHLVVPILVPGPSMQPRMVRTTWVNGEVARGYQETGEGYRAPPPGSGRSCAVQQCGEVSCFGSPTPVAAMVLPSPGRSSTGRVDWRHHSSFRLTFTSEST